ncbi:thermonuclease family protein [Rhizobium azibense]|uniref:Endonuclease YncB(Thermonuclease family) n=1 Tax=Rhizobium azibense TaxID=1136135 RepID=A0A4R3RXH2_9HYPH|nr:thermonuclease family protein [Rhizobium azibense]TCU39934.1 endonuclease YncB(thermonuclease family) [Rhizobium azibense]
MARGFKSIRDGVTALAILALIWLFAAKLDDRPDTLHSGRFHAADGDSLTTGAERMRLKGIDAPELHQSCERGGKRWACGRAAKEALQALVSERDTRCGGAGRDHYDRLLVVCRSGGIDLNAEMVARGMAVSNGDYEREEARARAQRAGLWAGAFKRPRDVRDHERRQSGLEDARR